MRTSTVWDKIGSLTPTRDAAVATSGGDATHVPEIVRDGRLHSDLPIPYRAPSALDLATCCVDLTGLRVGRLVALGLALKSGKKGARWVCRCDCGRYSGHSAKALRNPVRPEEMMCGECHHLHHLRYLDRSSKGSTEAALREQESRLDELAQRLKQGALSL